MNRTTASALAAGTMFVALLPACDNTDPVSPRALTVVVDAEPVTIEVGGSATITVSAFDPDGNPVASQPVTLETSLGSLEQTELTLDAMGQASTVLDAGAEPGTATVTATVDFEGQPNVGLVEVEIVEPEPPPSGSP